jgi:lipopolysaccharide/colanic/teichoic acid biosynthesis glycosyltransferase
MLAPASLQSETRIPGTTESLFSTSFKRLLDLAFIAVFGIVALPMIAIAWSLVRLTSAGPGFYSQTRVGRKGRVYRIHKIRTMLHNCESSTGATWCRQGDPRVTWIGRVLRKLHIDELPQLWNVLRGEMSLVGPRPERPEFVGPLSQQLENYDDRHTVRPGVTGLAQIQLPADQDLESVRKKLVLDRCYVMNRSFWLDVRILLGTMIYLVGFSYSLVRKLVWLPNPLENLPRSNPSIPPRVESTQLSDNKQLGVLAIEGTPIVYSET